MAPCTLDLKLTLDFEALEGGGGPGGRVDRHQASRVSDPSATATVGYRRDELGARVDGRTLHAGWSRFVDPDRADLGKEGETQDVQSFTERAGSLRRALGRVVMSLGIRERGRP